MAKAYGQKLDDECLLAYLMLIGYAELKWHVI